jgi:hypothetical protein
MEKIGWGIIINVHNIEIYAGRTRQKQDARYNENHRKMIFQNTVKITKNLT